MSNLIPTPRTDKNGRTVVRHMKPQGIPSQNVPPMPVPTLDIFSALNMTTIPAEATSLDDVWKTHRISKSRHTQDSFDPRAVQEVDKLLVQGVELERAFGVKLAVASALTLMSEYGLPVGFHNLAVFGECALRHSNADVTDYIAALHEMNAPREIDYLLDVDDDERNKAKTLVEFTVRLNEALGAPIIYYSSEDPEEVVEFTQLRDPELTNFILANPDSADDVFEVLVAEGGPVPVEVIKERLVHPEKALSRGVL